MGDLGVSEVLRLFKDKCFNQTLPKAILIVAKILTVTVVNEELLKSQSCSKGFAVSWGIADWAITAIVSFIGVHVFIGAAAENSVSNVFFIHK